MKSNIIDEEAAISIGFATILLGGMFWLGSVSAKGEQTVTRVDRLEHKQEEVGPALEDIRSRLIRIETKLGTNQGDRHGRQGNRAGSTGF